MEIPNKRHWLLEEIEIDLLRAGREQAGEMQEAALIAGRNRGELRRQQRRAVEIEIAPPQVGKALRQVSRGVARLEIRRGEVAQHRVITC